MYKLLRLQNFRSYDDYSIELDDGVNIVVGPNASGKTNLLEAIYMVSQGRSFRSNNREAITDNKEWLRVDAHNLKNVRTIKLQPPKRLELLIKDKPLPQKDRWKKQVPVVLFMPDHLRLLSGSPSRRRDFIDELLSKSSHEYSESLRRYNRALAQRNKLLKSDHVADDELFVWDLKMAEHGSMMTEARKDLISLINKKISKLYSTIAGKKQPVKAIFKTNSGNKNTLLKSLHKSKEIDMGHGFTHVGPHRDDLTFILNKQDAQSHASRGETRSLVLALKMVEEEVVKAAHDVRPIMLLDDVFSELDAARRRHLTEYFKNHQVIITTTDADAVIEHFSSGAYKIIPTEI